MVDKLCGFGATKLTSKEKDNQDSLLLQITRILAIISFLLLLLAFAIDKVMKNPVKFKKTSEVSNQNYKIVLFTDNNSGFDDDSKIKLEIHDKVRKTAYFSLVPVRSYPDRLDSLVLEFDGTNESLVAVKMKTIDQEKYIGLLDLESHRYTLKTIF